MEGAGEVPLVVPARVDMTEDVRCGPRMRSACTGLFGIGTDRKRTEHGGVR
jgi:hypothetical protein